MLGFRTRMGFRQRGTCRLPSTTFEGQIKLPDGSQASPSIAHNGDDDTGFYFADNTIYSVAGGNRVFSAGQFGLSVLDVNANFFQGTTYAGDGAVSWGADQTDYALSSSIDTLFVSVTAAGVDLNSMSGGSDGRTISIVVSSASANPLNVVNNAGVGTATMKIRTKTGANVSIPAGGGMTLRYSTQDNLWHEI